MSDEVEGTEQQRRRFRSKMARRGDRCRDGRSHFFAEADDTCIYCGMERP